MTYQASFLAPSGALSRREPRQRKNESWQAYCVRHETWRRLAYRERTPAERRRAVEQNGQFRENCLRANDVFCYRQIEKSKKEYVEGIHVFFWFGGEVGFPGAQSQYLNRATLDYFLLKTGDKKQARRGKVRVSFGPCLNNL